MEEHMGKKVAQVTLTVVPMEVRHFCIDARDSCQPGAIQIEQDLCATHY